MHGDRTENHGEDHMKRRSFLQNVAVASAAINWPSRKSESVLATTIESPPTPTPDIAGHTLVCSFKIDTTNWKVYEDLRTREGVLTFISSRGDARVLGKSAEATFAESDPPHLGLSMNEIGLSDADLLADRLLAGSGDPDPEMVKAAAPPLGSFTPPTTAGAPGTGPNPRT